jgi:SAM-dependent methyltransferase
MSSPTLDPFLRPVLGRDTQDRYLIRTAILTALKSQCHHFTGAFLDVGCGIQPYRSLVMATGKVSRYIGMDLQDNMVSGYRAVPPDLQWNGTHIPLEDASVDSAMATEVLEHCPDAVAVLKEIHRVLRPGGVFFFTVPFLWPLHDVPYDEHRYTPFALERMLDQVGFVDRIVRPTGGWDASLAQMLGLWVSRRPMSPRKRRILKRITVPIVRMLAARDTIPEPLTGPMITGVWGVAKKRGK